MERGVPETLESRQETVKAFLSVSGANIGQRHQHRQSQQRKHLQRRWTTRKSGTLSWKKNNMNPILQTGPLQNFNIACWTLIRMAEENWFLLREQVGMIMRSIRYIRSEKMEKSIWRMILQPVMDSVIPQNIRRLHMTASDRRKCLRVWNITQWTERKWRKVSR